MTEQDDPHELVAEHHHQFDNIPVAICVLETKSKVFGVGFSAVHPRKFDPVAAQDFARGRARQHLASLLGKRA